MYSVLLPLSTIEAGASLRGDAGRIRQQHLRSGVADRMVGLQEEPGANRVRVVELVSSIALQGIGDVLLEGVLRRCP